MGAKKCSTDRSFTLYTSLFFYHAKQRENHIFIWCCAQGHTGHLFLFKYQQLKGYANILLYDYFISTENDLSKNMEGLSVSPPKHQG